MPEPTSINDRCDAEAQVAFQFCFKEIVLFRFKA